MKNINFLTILHNCDRRAWGNTDVVLGSLSPLIKQTCDPLVRWRESVHGELQRRIKVHCKWKGSGWNTKISRVEREWWYWQNWVQITCRIGEGRESWYAFYFLGHQWKTISQTDLPNNANENSKSWALLMIITMAVESMISRVWGYKKRSSSVSTLPPGRETWYAWWGELIRPIYTTVAV